MNISETDEMNHNDSYIEWNSTQRPQLNARIGRHASGCERCQNIGEGGDDGPDSDGRVDDGYFIMEHRHAYATGGNDGDSMTGDEGLENYKIESPSYERHEIEVGDLGWIRLSDLFLVLARHGHCTCHNPGVLPDEYITETNTPMRSGLLSASSVLAEQGSGEHSMDASGHLPRSTSCSGFLRGMGAGLSVSVPFQPTPGNKFTAPPIELTAQPAGGRKSHFDSFYPPELSFSEHELDDDEVEEEEDEWYDNDGDYDADN